MLFLSFSLIGFQIQIREYRSFPPFSDCPSHPSQSRPCKSSVVDYMKQTFVPRSKLFQGRAFDAVCRRRRRPFQRVRSKWPTAHSLGITLQIELQRVTSFASILGHWHVWPFPPSWPIGIEKLHTPSSLPIRDPLFSLLYLEPPLLPPLVHLPYFLRLRVHYRGMVSRIWSGGTLPLLCFLATSSHVRNFVQLFFPPVKSLSSQPTLRRDNRGDSSKIFHGDWNAEGIDSKDRSGTIQ